MSVSGFPNRSALHCNRVPSRTRIIRLFPAAVAFVSACVGADDSTPASLPAARSPASALPVIRQVALDQLAPDAVGTMGGWLAVGPDGRIAFVPAATPEETYRIRIVDSTGAVLARVGPQGAGPGELTMPMFFDFTDNGSLVAWDASTTRVTRYSSSGTLVSSQQIDQLQMPVALVNDSLDSRSASPDDPYVRRSTTGGRTRPLMSTTHQVFDSVFPIREAGGIRSRLAIPYASGAGQIALGHATSYRILLFDDAGVYLGSAGRMLPPQFPSPEAIAAESLSLARQPSVSPAQRARLLAASRTQPIQFFSRGGLKFDHLGRLWVVRQEGGSAAADVYSVTTLLGTVMLDCPGFTGNGVGLKYGWLVLSCRTIDPEAPSVATLRLFRIDG